MQLAALTSLAEVGIAVNLGFSLLVAVKDALGSWLRSCVAESKGRCVVKGDLPFTSPQSLYANLERFQTWHAAINAWIGRVFVAFAVVGAATLIMFLWCVAQHGTLAVPEVWATWILVIGVGPALITIALQLIAFAFAWAYLQLVNHIIGLALDGVPTQPSAVTDDP